MSIWGLTGIAGGLFFTVTQAKSEPCQRLRFLFFWLQKTLLAHSLSDYKYESMQSMKTSPETVFQSLYTLPETLSQSLYP